MSAFQVSDTHIGALVRFYLSEPDYRRTFSEMDGEEVFRTLAEECFKSVSYRYPAKDGEPLDLPGPIEFNNRPVEQKQPISAYPKLTPVSIIKQCHCYNYQSCEHPGWETSVARAIVQDIIECAVRVLPGYDEAPWGI